MNLLTSETMCARADVSYRQLNRWTTIGVLRPYVAARGQGSARRWLPAQVGVVRALGHLAALGATAAVLASVADQLERLGPDDWRGLAFVGPDGEVTSDAIGMAWVVDLAECSGMAEFHAAAAL